MTEERDALPDFGVPGTERVTLTSNSMTLFEAMGGAPTFEALVEVFYQGVANDPLLRPMYPESLEESKRNLALFLMQYFGGPDTYSQERGHPRLRMRHQPFAISRAARDAWMKHMSAAIGTLEVSELAKEQLGGYFEGAATFMINSPDYG